MLWIIDLIEFGLKVILSLHIIIFLRKIYHIMADSEKVLNDALSLLDDEDNPKEVSEHRDMLIGLSQSGLLQKIGVKKTESQLAMMPENEVEKVYCEYQRRYTACVSDDVVSNILYGYAAFCHWLSPRTEKEKLTKELKENFVIGAEIKKQLGRFGLAMSPWLAVANTAVITAKNVNFKKTEPPTDESSGDLTSGLVVT
jgi:hypothetical protein